tara:strand:- start:565 stop:912 length:348 start_codon:yes stop_codon:yes gene_type:complete
MAKRRKGKSRAATHGELPGEYLKRSLVSVPTGMLAEGGRIPEDHWIVKTRRLDGRFTVEVEHKGETMSLPHKVVMQVERHLTSIRKAQRSDASRDRAQERMQNGLIPFERKEAAS